MRTITLEFLRHGPPHNQLLSPLTQYLALCENHPAVTISVPFEHNQLRHRLDNLCYRHGSAAREFDVRDTARILGDMMAQIPGLTAELSREEGDVDLSTHLRLIISSSELALIPFEMASAPNGFPGAGQPLSLQTQAPLCVTREVRRVPATTTTWQRAPRILVVAASPPNYEPVPLAAHLLAIREALDPWLSTHEPEKQFQEFVTVLPNASDIQVERICAENNFTHIHILAHGEEFLENYDTRYGLAFHDPRDPDGEASIVSGERLSTILRPARQPNSDPLASPNIVTLASCYSGNAGGITSIGASVAHALHQSGIPIVISSQFPLSFSGSITMVEVLYRGLLWGIDPRVLLGDLRRRLHSQFPNNHDWASISAYAALPTPFQGEMKKFQLMQAKECAEAAFGAVDRMTATRFYGDYFGSTIQNDPNFYQLWTEPESDAAREMDARIANKIELAKSKLIELQDSDDIEKPKLFGQLASIEKRLAEIHQEDTIKTVNLLRQSRKYYWDAYQENRSNSWGLVQYLSISVVLSRLKALESKPTKASDIEQRLWTLAVAISEQDMNSPDIDISGWAIANLIELHLLALVVGGMTEHYSIDEHTEVALHLADKLVQKRGEGAFEVYSTRRQMARYAVWFDKIAVFKDPGRQRERLSEDLVDALHSTWKEGDEK